jgi:hypothetical protein
MRRFVAILVLLALAGCGSSQPPGREAAAARRSSAPAVPASSAPPPAPTAGATVPATAAQLPLGGTRMPKLRKAAGGFAGGRKIQIAYELIASVAQGKPGADGDYSQMIAMDQIQRYVDQARRNKVLVILDLQPGSGSFLPQARRLERFLVQPHVGIALDPEWRMPTGKVPGKTIGRVGAAEVNAVSAYVSGLVARNRLPQKLFVLHQFRASMLPDVQAVRKRPGLAMVQHVDGFGTRSEKNATWNRLRRPQQFHMGYKLFYDEDVRRYGPADVLKFKPVPELISYQ